MAKQQSTKSILAIEFPFQIPDELYMSISAGNSSYQFFINTDDNPGKLTIRKYGKYDIDKKFPDGKSSLVSALIYANKLVEEGYKLEYKEAKKEGEIVPFDAEDLKRLLEYTQLYIKENKIKILNYDPNSSASYNKLLNAIKTGDLALVKRYIEEVGVNPSLRLKTKRIDYYFIKEALLAGQVEIVNYLVPLVSRYEKDYSPLADYCLNPDDFPANTFDVLMKAGYDPASSKITLDKYTEFKVADNIRLDILAKADKRGGNPIFWAFAYLGQYVENYAKKLLPEVSKRIRELINAGCDPNDMPDNISGARHPLYKAMQYFGKDTDIIKLLVEKGAKIPSWQLKEAIERFGKRVSDENLELVKENSFNPAPEENTLKEESSVERRRRRHAAAEASRKQSTLPADDWEKHSVSVEGCLTNPETVKVLTIPDFEPEDDYFHYLGDDRFGMVSDNIMKVIDTAYGGVIWETGNYNDFGNSSGSLYDEKADLVYVPSALGNTRSFVAHEAESGDIKWTCKLAATYYQFGMFPVQSEKYLCAVNVENKKATIVNKETGKVSGRIPLQNIIRHWSYRDAMFWNDNLVMMAVNKKTDCFVLDLYRTDTNEFDYTISLFQDQQPLAIHIENDFIYILTTLGYVFKVDLNDGSIISKVHFDLSLFEGLKELERFDDFSCEGTFKRMPDNKLRWCIYNDKTAMVGYYDLNDDTAGAFNLGARIINKYDFCDDLFYYVSDKNNLAIYDTISGKKVTDYKLPAMGNSLFLKVIGKRAYIVQKTNNGTIFLCVS